MRRRLLIVITVACAALGSAAGGAGAAGRSDARAFTTATLAFDLARGRAGGRAERLGDTRRANAATCLETLRGAPAERREELFRLYFTWVSAGYFTEDEPIFARWVRALKRVSTTDPALRGARAALGRQLTAARRIYAQGRRFCTPVEAWARAGWTVAGRPTPVLRLRKLASLTADPQLRRDLSAAARKLRSTGGQGGALAASALREGIDEGDDRVVEAGDPIVALLSDLG